MFITVLVEDDIPIAATNLRHDCCEMLKREIQKKYVDRILPDVGLCIEFYDIVAVKDALIHPGDGKSLGRQGEPYFKVEFNLIVFRPFVDEYLVGSIVSCHRTTGIHISLGFFDDVRVAPTSLQSPHIFDRHMETWVWQYRQEGETTNLFYEPGELVRFRVVSVNFPAPASSKEKNSRSAMFILGAMDMDGLGCVKWWPNGPDGLGEDKSRTAAPEAAASASS